MHAVMQPKSKFLGNSAASILDGYGQIEILSLGEEYVFRCVRVLPCVRQIFDVCAIGAARAVCICVSVCSCVCLSACFVCMSGVYLCVCV